MTRTTHGLTARRALATACAVTLTATLAATPARADISGETATSLSAVPNVQGPIAETADSHMWGSTKRARVPFDVADFGYVEEEFFLSGSANIYDQVDGEVTVVGDPIAYVNPILVRRPAAEVDSSGVVLVEILNASDGFNGEGLFRRTGQWALDEGHTVIAMTSKPIQISSLQNYDPERYADATWNTDPDFEREPILADSPGYNNNMVVEGAEEGLTWDITSQLGALLNSDQAGNILGGQKPSTNLLMGQSQSGVNLNTYVANFHSAQVEANGGSVWDGYLSNVAATLQRSLRQGGAASTAPLADIDVPQIFISSEGDAGLFGGPSVLAKANLFPNQVHWQVPGTPHSDALSPLIPSDAEILQAGRLPNTQIQDQAFRDSLNLYPLSPTVVAATQALINAHRDGAALPPSQWMDQADNKFIRDASGNVTGGLRYGLIEYPLGQYLGAAAPFKTYGSMDLISAEEFADSYGSRADYLTLLRNFDDAQMKAGYLTKDGAESFMTVANELLDRIGVPATPPAAESLSATPAVKGPIAETADTHMWSSMKRARVPFDVADFGYVEEEFFLTGNANVYDRLDGDVTVIGGPVPYVSPILVRRPSAAADSSGVVLVDIYNASNGFPGEDHWRRMWQWAFDEGHTVIGVASKPIQISALQNYDPERYADLSWDTDPNIERAPIVAGPSNPDFSPGMVVEGAEEGLTWDITTQLGVLLAGDEAGSVLGGQEVRTSLLMGQSQSGININTYIANFHTAQAAANGDSVWDGYLTSVGAAGQRSLRQGGAASRDPLPAIEIPHILVTSEGDASLFGGPGLLAKTELPANRVHWQVPGTPHTDLLSTVIPADSEIYKAGRLPNTQVLDKAFRDALNLYPLEPAIVAAAQALIDADQDASPLPASQWLDQADGQLLRDKAGNVTGGVRYGLIEHPLGQYLGAADRGAVYGSMDLITAAKFAETYGTRVKYLDLITGFDETQVEAGYLTAYGAQYLEDVANELLDRIGVPQTEPTPTDTPTPTPTPTPSGTATTAPTASVAPTRTPPMNGGVRPGLPNTGV